jgi:hypothetical protein
MTTLQPHTFEGSLLGWKQECGLEIVDPKKAVVHFTYNDKPYAMCLFDDQTMSTDLVMALCADYRRRNGSDGHGTSYEADDLVMSIAKHAIACLDRILMKGGWTQVMNYSAALRVDASGVVDGTVSTTDDLYVTSIVLIVTTFVLHSNFLSGNIKWPQLDWTPSV